MRRGPKDNVHVSILPYQRRTAKQSSVISDFHLRPKKLDRSEFTRTYSAASALLEEVDGSPGFCHDTLRDEVSGPKQPHLALVVKSCVITRDLSRKLIGDVVGFA